MHQNVPNPSCFFVYSFVRGSFSWLSCHQRHQLGPRLSVLLILNIVSNTVVACNCYIVR